MKVNCTWGDGPDVTVNLSGTKVILYKSPEANRLYKYGTVTEGTFDLTDKEARQLATDLNQAAAEVKSLESQAKDHDVNYPTGKLFDW